MYLGPEVAVPAALFSCITFTILGSKWISYRKASLGSGPGGVDGLEKRLARVEVALDDLTTEIGRVVEGQQFLTKVLSEQTPQRAFPAPKQP